jgi:hypothetical protein
VQHVPGGRYVIRGRQLWWSRKKQKTRVMNEREKRPGGLLRSEAQRATTKSAATVLPAFTKSSPLNFVTNA